MLSSTLKPLPNVTNEDSTVELGSGDWLSLSRITFRSETDNLARQWEVCNRKPTGACAGARLDAVDVQAFVRRRATDASPSVTTVLLVVQYRPPVNMFCVEFPSGLIDADETIEEAALRELLEETGYTGKVTYVGPETSYEPGLTSSCSKVAIVDVDGDAPENAAPKQKLGHDEWSLQAIELPINGLFKQLQDLQAEHRIMIDSRLYCFALGIDICERAEREHALNVEH